MILSILIPTNKETRKKLDRLLTILLPQTKDYEDQLEIYIEGDNKMGLGKKCNSLLKDATGEYIWFLSDSDIVSETAVFDLFKAIESKRRQVSILGATKNINWVQDWKTGINTDRPFCWNSPMKRSLVKKFKNNQKSVIRRWIKEMNEPVHPFVSEAVIEKPIVRNNIELHVVKSNT